MLPDLTTDVFSRYNRQAQVEDNSCGSGGAEGLQGRLAITPDFNGISLGLKEAFQCLLSASIILDDQNRFHESLVLANRAATMNRCDSRILLGGTSYQPAPNRSGAVLVWAEGLFRLPVSKRVPEPPPASLGARRGRGP